MVKGIHTSFTQAQVLPIGRLYFILLYNLCIFREVKLQQHAGVVLETVEPIEGRILVNLYKAMNPEWLPVLMKLLNYLQETAILFIFPQSLLPFTILLILSSQVLYIPGPSSFLCSAQHLQHLGGSV